MPDPNGTAKTKFTRKYYTYNPNVYQGPPTEVLDTVLKVVPKEENG